MSQKSKVSIITVYVNYLILLLNTPKIEVITDSILTNKSKEKVVKLIFQIGVLLFDNGRIYEGHWENDRRHGYGYEYFSSGATYVGYYTNNKPHGRKPVYLRNGEI